MCGPELVVSDPTGCICSNRARDGLAGMAVLLAVEDGVNLIAGQVQQLRDLAFGEPIAAVLQDLGVTRLVRPPTAPGVLRQEPEVRLVVLPPLPQILPHPVLHG